MSNVDIAKLADHLAQAEATGQGVAPLTELVPEITVEQAYHVQLETISRKVSQGARIVGKKIGLTSKAMQNLLGVGEPDYGHLLDHMEIPNNGVLEASKTIYPRVEAEIAFVLKKDLEGPMVTELDVLQATDYVVGALEIVDSRVKDWKIKLADTVADNASSGFFVLGEKKLPVSALSLDQIGSVLYVNGEIANTGVGAAALGSPAKCVAWLANKLHQFGIKLQAGEVILSGALSAAVTAQPGDTFKARFGHLGEVSVSFGK